MAKRMALHRGDSTISIGRYDGEGFDAKLESDARYNLDGTLKRHLFGPELGLTPNDVKYMAWRQSVSVDWSEKKCRAEWKKLGNPEPKQ